MGLKVKKLSLVYLFLQEALCYQGKQSELGGKKLI